MCDLRATKPPPASTMSKVSQEPMVEDCAMRLLLLSKRADTYWAFAKALRATELPGAHALAGVTVVAPVLMISNQSRSGAWAFALPWKRTVLVLPALKPDSVIVVPTTVFQSEPVGRN